MKKLKGKHKNPIAAVYKLTDNTNGKIYIGETSDLLNRITSHKGTPRRKSKYIVTKLEKAIAKKGYDAFTLDVLIDDREDPMIADLDYRREKEAEYIRSYNSTDPDIGYNSTEINHTMRYTGRMNYPTGRLNSEQTRLKLSKAIIAYNHKTKISTMYFSAATYAKAHGISDRSIISNAASHGRTIHGVNFFLIDDDLYRKHIEKTVTRRVKSIQQKNLSYPTSLKALRRYITAVKAVNGWRDEFGFEPYDIDAFLDSLDFNIDSYSK